MAQRGLSVNTDLRIVKFGNLMQIKDFPATLDHLHRHDCLESGCGEMVICECHHSRSVMVLVRLSSDNTTVHIKEGIQEEVMAFNMG